MQSDAILRYFRGVRESNALGAGSVAVGSRPPLPLEFELLQFEADFAEVPIEHLAAIAHKQ
jgi:hypothetical protein